MSQTPAVLVVDDRVENLLAVEAVLAPLRVDIYKARSAEEALRILLERDFAVILLDIQMPGIDGFQAAAMIRNRPRSEKTPIIFLTAVDRGGDTVNRGYALGAVDYLVKPFQPDILRWKVSVFVELFQKAEQEKELLREQMARVESEAMARSAALLAECSSALASSMHHEEMLEALAHVLVPRFAGGVAVYMNRGELGLQLRCLAGECVNHLDTSPAESRNPVVRAFRTTRIIADGNAIFMPIQGRSKPLGVMALYGPAGAPFRDSDLLFAEDLTRRIALGVSNAQLYEASQDANRAKDQFLAVVSHELRTPLTAIIGWVHLLLTRDMDAEAAHKALRIVERNARLQHDLIADILDFSGIVTGQLPVRRDDVRIRNIVEDAVETIRPQAEEKKIELLSSFAADSPVITGDARRLQQVFSNLCSNAVKFTPEGGRIEIAFDVSDTQVCIRVSDTGVGISAELIPRVFEPFVQGDSSNTRGYPGLGLGLAIVRRLVELHGGNILVESAGKDRGASFSVMLPLRHLEARAS